jgi:hypothetical protein
MITFLLWIWIAGAAVGWIMSLNWHLSKNAEGIKKGLPDNALGIFLSHVFWYTVICFFIWPWVIKDVNKDNQY